MEAGHLLAADSVLFTFVTNYKKYPRAKSLVEAYMFPTFVIDGIRFLHLVPFLFITKTQ
jgi:hypothetical protein